MKDNILWIVLYLAIGLALQWVSGLLGSKFLSDFIEENLITLLIALLAINTTTISVIMTKLREISDKKGGNFTNTVTAMKKSIIEQVVLLAVATILLIVKSSTLIAASWPEAPFVLNTLLVAVLVYAIHLLYDTANGIFIILHYENNNAKKAHVLLEQEIINQQDGVHIKTTCSCGVHFERIGNDEASAAEALRRAFISHSSSN